MRLKIEDFIESEEQKCCSEEVKLKKTTKLKFDKFYSNYDRLSSGNKLPKLQLTTLKSMLINESKASAVLSVAECDQIWQQVSLSCEFLGKSVPKSVKRLIHGETEEEINAEVEEFDFEDDEEFENELEALDDDLDGELENVDEDLTFEMGEFSEDEGSEVSEELNFADDPKDDESEIEQEDEEGKNLDLNEDFDEDDEKYEENADERKVNGDTKESVFEDDFLKIEELEAFLDQEDKKDEKLMKRLENPHMYDDDSNQDDENEDYVDYFSNISGQKGSEINYKDFFDIPQGNTFQRSKNNRSVHFADENIEEDDEYFEGKKRKIDLFEVNEESDDNVGEDLSLHEKRMQKYREKIDEMQENSLGEKPWQLMGEATAEKRPTDSLLAEVLQYDSSARPPPEITKEKTESLEQVILRRIKDKTFDDVMRKWRPKEAPFEYRKRILLEQDKSKMSLAEVYEQEFLKQVREDKVEEKNEKHEEIKEMMKKVFYKLDMLSHFSITPQAPSTEMKIVRNAPALSMEEAVPVALAESAQLAPEEVRKVSINLASFFRYFFLESFREVFSSG